MGNIPKITRNLLFINLVMFVGTLINEPLMTKWFALFPVQSHYFHWWQFITYMFMHGGWFHIFFNMYALVMFGSVVENIIGEKKFLVFYLLCGVGAAAFHILMSSVLSGNLAPMVGASGAIYGLLLAYAMLFPDSRMTLLFPPVTMKARTMALVFIGLEFFLGFVNVGGVAHFAHFGGMLAGFILMMYWRKTNKLFDRDIWI